MSKIALTPNASGTGTLTIAAPNTSTDRTINLPDETGSIITTGSSGQVIPAAALPAGSVLQVVNTATSSSVATTSSSYTAATGLTASITPSSTLNKILVTFSINIFITGAAGTSKINIYRGGSSIKSFEYTAYAGTSTLMSYPTCIFLDSPSSTSSLTYQIYFNSNTGTNIIYNYTDANGTPTSTITLMEIAA